MFGSLFPALAARIRVKFNFYNLLPNRTYMWGVIYLRNIDPAVWYDTDIKLFQVQRVQ
jgi:hypothetical protein